MGRINVTFTIFEELMLQLSKEVEEELKEDEKRVDSEHKRKRTGMCQVQGR